MNSANKPLLNWFGYTRKERRSSFILLLILIIVIASRYLFQTGEREIEIKNLAGLSVSGDTLEAGFSDIGIDEKTAAIKPYMVIEKETGSTRNYKSASRVEQKSLKKLDLNKCDSAALVKLAGLGPVLSSRIIKFRRLLGGFASAEQLKEVYGLPETTYNYLAGKVFADSADVSGIKINDIGFNELSRHPYLTRYEIESIIKYKQLKGRFSNIAELVDNKIISPEKARKLSPYLKF